MSDVSPSCHQLRERSFEDDAPAVFARARTQIDDVIGGAHHVRIVLHHHDRVAQVAQLFEDSDQPAGVAAVQADGRLVEHVARAHQPRSEAGRELDALRFAARKRRRQPVQRQIFETDVVQKFQALLNFDQDLFGDRGFFGRQVAGRRKTSCASAIFMRDQLRPDSSRPRECTALPAAAAIRRNPDTCV